MDATDRIAAIVLAAGSSRRMGGRNKLLVPRGGCPLVRHVVTTILKSQADPVVVVLGHEAEAVRTVLADLPVTFVFNPRHTEGMTTSIQAGVAAVSTDVLGYMICLSDQPLIEASEYDRLIDAFRQAYSSNRTCIVVPEFEGRRGNPVLFSACYRQDILAVTQRTGCRSLVSRHAAQVVRVTMSTDHVLQDIDTPEALAALMKTHPADAEAAGAHHE